jgi:hypothetical protein
MQILTATTRDELIKIIESLNDDGESEPLVKIFWWLQNGNLMTITFNLAETYRTCHNRQGAVVDACANFGKDLKFKNPNSLWVIRKQQIIKNIKALPKYCT